MIPVDNMDNFPTALDDANPIACAEEMLKSNAPVL